LGPVVTLYKMTGPERTTYNGFRWPEIGEWAEVGKSARKALTEGELCTSRVLHVTDFEHLLNWANVELYEVEVDESRGIIRGSDKIGVRRARLTKRVETWNERTARLFAADCAERVLPLFEKERPNDARQREAIAVARRFARGEATREELDAARAAARDPARAAARAAAWAAARDAARDAAWDAARDAAGAAARAAAWDAARDAAWAAARDAAWAAAWAAERQWQRDRLVAYFGGAA
jgi:hypothetical protein